MKHYVNLNGLWDFVADLDPKYHLDERIYPDCPYARPDANRRHWKKVTVPGVWQKYGERYDIFEGICWFAREFELMEAASTAKCRLRFSGVNYYCRVFLNGRELGSHETGYTEFTLDATGHVKSGTNHIAVMVDNRATTTKWPPCLGYFNYGGIHRDVVLEIMTGGFLEDVVISQDYLNDLGYLTISGKVEGYSHHANQEGKNGLRIETFCHGQTFQPEINEDGSFIINASLTEITPWTPDAPYLYPLVIRLLQDERTIDFYETECGFRSIEVQGGKIHLNGEPLELKGVCYVFDSPVQGLVMTIDQIEADVAIMKEMGCNSVRAHYPMGREFYRVCDRLGLLVWIEPTVYCLHPLDEETNTPFSDPHWIRLAEQMVSEMIRVARNHPCVAIYGIGNECNTENLEADNFFRRLAQKIRQEDATRIISYAALYGIVGKIAEIVDVLGINSYWGWYDKIFGGKGLKPESDEWQVRVEQIDLTPMRDMLDKVLQTSGKHLVLLLTEFGADSVPGYYSASKDLWSEEYHAELLKEVFRLTDEYPQIAGTFPFCFSDYRDPSKVPNGYWNEINLKGVVTYDRRKKLAFESVRKYYNLG